MFMVAVYLEGQILHSTNIHGKIAVKPEDIEIVIHGSVLMDRIEGLTTILLHGLHHYQGVLDIQVVPDSTNQMYNSINAWCGAYCL